MRKHVISIRNLTNATVVLASCGSICRLTLVAFAESGTPAYEIELIKKSSEIGAEGVKESMKGTRPARLRERVPGTRTLYRSYDRHFNA